MWQSRLSEFQQLVIAWLALGFCFSVSGIFSLNFPLIISSLIAVGAGFIGHELAHKFVAQRYGWKAGFRLWPQGLLLALIIALISGGQFIFAAPGAVYLVPLSIGYSSSPSQSKREYGIISLSGPLMNLVFASIFLALFRISDFSILNTISFRGFFVNLFLGAFNTVPFPPLDGAKIFSWKKLIWALLAIPTWLALVYIYF